MKKQEGFRHLVVQTLKQFTGEPTQFALQLLLLGLKSGTWRKGHPPPLGIQETGVETPVEVKGRGDLEEWHREYQLVCQAQDRRLDPALGVRWI